MIKIGHLSVAFLPKKSEPARITQTTVFTVLAFLSGLVLVPTRKLRTRQRLQSRVLRRLTFGDALTEVRGASHGVPLLTTASQARHAPWFPTE